MKDLKNIEFAVSFESAIPLLKAKKFDFILMDINLQGEYNGLDALRIIQKMPGYKNVPIIATTAYVQPGARERFISAGFSDYLPKPLLREKIIESLQNLLQ
jgi:CheY-like chemotaxis protein